VNDNIALFGFPIPHILAQGKLQYADFQEAQDALSSDQTKLLALEVM
jgi:hypothetical protein